MHVYKYYTCSYILRYSSVLLILAIPETSLPTVVSISAFVCMVCLHACVVCGVCVGMCVCKIDYDDGSNKRSGRHRGPCKGRGNSS